MADMDGAVIAVAAAADAGRVRAVLDALAARRAPVLLIEATGDQAARRRASNAIAKARFALWFASPSGLGDADAAWAMGEVAWFRIPALAVPLDAATVETMAQAAPAARLEPWPAPRGVDRPEDLLVLSERVRAVIDGAKAADARSPKSEGGAPTGETDALTGGAGGAAASPDAALGPDDAEGAPVRAEEDRGLLSTPESEEIGRIRERLQEAERRAAAERGYAPAPSRDAPRRLEAPKAAPPARRPGPPVPSPVVAPPSERAAEFEDAEELFLDEQEIDAPDAPYEAIESIDESHPDEAEDDWSDADGVATAPPAPAPAPAPAPPGAGERSEAASALRAAHLVENAPRRLRIGDVAEIAVRIGFADESDVGALAAGMAGRVAAHSAVAARAMSVTLDDPSLGFAIRPLTPETQWVDRAASAALGFAGAAAHAEWRWSVEALKGGARPLVIRASARIVDADGVAADAGLPEQRIVVRVRTHPGRAAGRAVRWAAIAAGAGVLGHYGTEIVEAARALL